MLWHLPTGVAQADGRHRVSVARALGLPALAAATAIGATGLAAGGTAGALVGTELTGSAAAAGVPLGLLVVGSAGAALVIARRSARAGRAGSLALGYLAGAAGALLAILATAAGSLPALLIGSTLLGAGNAAIFLTRYAAAELGGEHARGRALGAVLAATAIGAVASPNLLGPGGAAARVIGLPRLAGPYAVALLVFLAAALILVAARPGAQALPAPVTRGELVAGLARPPVRAALIVLAATNLIMVAIMAVAPVSLMDQGAGLGVIGIVISVHVAGMFAPAPVTGWLADRAGAATVVLIGVGLLIAAGVAGALTGVGHLVPTTMVLALLGIGWNCGVVGGSTLLAGGAPTALRPYVEGIGEAAMGVAAAVGAPVAGLVLAFTGLPVVWLLTAGLAVLPVLALRAAARGGVPS